MGCPWYLCAHVAAAISLSFLDKVVLKLTCTYISCAHTAFGGMVIFFVLWISEKTLSAVLKLSSQHDFSTASTALLFYRKLKNEVSDPALSSSAIPKKHPSNKK